MYTSTYNGVSNGTSDIDATALNYWGFDAVAGNADDTIKGGNGNDAITVGNGSDTITEKGVGLDNVTVGDGNNQITVYGPGTITVGGGNNQITINANGTEIVQGIPGDDDGDNIITDPSGSLTVNSLGNGDNSIRRAATLRFNWPAATTQSLGGVATITVGNGNNAISSPVFGGTITVGSGDNTIYQTADGTSAISGNISVAGGNNTFFMNGQSPAGTTTYISGYGTNDLVVANLAAGTSATVGSTDVGLPSGSQINFGSGSVVSSISTLVNGGGVANTLTLDDGGDVTLPTDFNFPSGSNLKLENGTSLNLEDQSIVVGLLTLDDGTITGGGIDASAYNLENGDIDSNLSDGTVTVNGGSVTLTGTNSFGPVTISGGTLAVPSAASLGNGTITFGPGGVLQALGDLTSSQSIVTPSGVSATIDSNGNTVTWSGGITGAGSMIFADSSGGGLVALSGNNGYGGGTAITGGMVEFSTLGSLPSTTPGSILIQAGGASRQAACMRRPGIGSNGESSTQAPWERWPWRPTSPIRSTFRFWATICFISARRRTRRSAERLQPPEAITSSAAGRAR